MRPFPVDTAKQHVDELFDSQDQALGLLEDLYGLAQDEVCNPKIAKQVANYLDNLQATNEIAKKLADGSQELRDCYASAGEA